MSTRAERRIQDFQRAVNQDLKDDAAQAAANQQATNTPTPPQRVVVLDGTRGKLGGVTLATVGQWTEVARFVNKQSKPIVLQSNVGLMTYISSAGPPPVRSPIPPLQAAFEIGEAATAFPRVNLRVQVGSGNEGGGSTTGTYYIVGGDLFEVAGTYVVVSAQIYQDETAGNSSIPYDNGVGSNTLDPTLQCQVSVSIAHGSPKVAMPTKWVQPAYNFAFGGFWLAGNEVSEQKYTGPGRIKQVHGFNNNGTVSDILFLMLFDITGAAGILNPGDNPITGAFPLFTIPMQGGNSPFSWDCIPSVRSFQQGLAVSLSSTGDQYTPAVGLTGYVRVDVELFAGAMLPPQ